MRCQIAAVETIGDDQLDVELDVRPSDLKLRDADVPTLREFYSRFFLKTALKDF